MAQRIDPIKRKPSYRLAAERIRRAIELGTYLPGERLPPSEEFAYQLGISVSALREATRGLIDEGLLEMRMGQKGGLVVLPRPQRRGRISKAVLAEVDQLTELRKAVETESARLAAERRDSDDLKRLDRLFDEMVAEIEAPEDELSGARFNRTDTQFHGAIAKASRNKLLLPIIEDTRVRVFSAVGVTLGPVTERLNQGHDAILREIHRGRPEAAAKAMRRHIEYTREDAHRVAEGTFPRQQARR